MGLLNAVVDSIFGKRQSIADREALVEFLDRHAAFMCQKCVVEFCRVRAGVYWQKLFTEEEFLAELNKSRWRSFVPATAMLAEMVEAALRPHAGLRQRMLPGVIEAAAAEVFARYPVPPGEDEDFWERGRHFLHERLEATQAGPPRAVKDMTAPSARLIFEALPIHKEIVTHDYDYIRNNLRMNLIRAHDDFIDMADIPALLEDLLGQR